jgi:CHAT domain-containing protein
LCSLYSHYEINMKTIKYILNLVMLVSVMALSAGASQEKKDMGELLSGAPFEKDLSAAETHVYRIPLIAGQFLTLEVEQRGIDLFATIFGPDNQQIGRSRSGLDQGTEPILFIAEVTGAYTLEVVAQNRKAAAGRYSIKVNGFRQATEKDKANVSGLKAYIEGERLREPATEQAFRKALEKYHEALLNWRAAENQGLMSASLARLGLLYSLLEEHEKAVDYSRQALALRKAAGDRKGEASVLTNLGLSYGGMGELQKAMECFIQALPILRDLGIRTSEARALNNLGIMYKRSGDLQKALECYSEALAIRRSFGKPLEEASALGNLGIIYELTGEREKALEHFTEALAIQRIENDRLGVIKSLNFIGRIISSMNEREKALDYFKQALSLARTLGHRATEAFSLEYMAETYKELGEQQKALELFNKALLIRREISHKPGEAETLANIARVERTLGNLDDAHGHIKSAINIIESLRVKVADPELRATFLASNQRHYEFYIDLLMELHRSRPSDGYDVLAIEISERGRARSLLETLTEANIDIRQGVDPELLERASVLRRQIETREEKRVQLLSGKYSQEQAAKATKELEELITQYQQVQAHIRSVSPRYIALTQPIPMSLAQMQQILDQDTMLLEYALGEDRSYLWVVTVDSFNVYELPNRAEIEKIARQVYELLVVSNKRESQRPAELAAARLSQIVLGPIAEKLGRKRLLVVGEGALQYVPFGALPTPRPNIGKRRSKPANITSGQPLIVDHEIVSLPSASVLGVLRKELAERQPAERMIAIFADPVLQQDDPRLQQLSKNREAEKGQQFAANNIERSAKDAGIVKFERLRFTRQEAEAIVAQAGEKESLTALDFAASRKTVAETDLQQFRIIHFATHGILNSIHPGLSGVVLSLVDEKGEPQNGFLRTHDIYNLKLKSELVVLSACRTALGREVKGEGLVGLVRGFMYAGSARVVASMWDVNDKSTAELMKRFYQGMLKDGLRPAAALRAAQVSMWKDRKWQSPYYWAGFVIQGEWR